jgi:Synergist-CTERM protein sorting domain-containing protein
MGGKIEGEVKQTDGTSSSSGGGCNAGYGLLGLLLAGLVTRKYRKA